MTQFCHKTIVSLLAAMTGVSVAGGDARGQDIEKVVEILKSQPEKAAHKETEDQGTESARSRAIAPLFFLRDQSKVAGFPRIDKLEVETRYGILHVPIEELARVRFARRIDLASKERIRGLIRQLGASDFDEREKAMDALRKEPAAIELLREAAKSPDEELQNRASVLVGELETRAKDAGEEEPALRGTDDEVQTERMTVRGIVLASEFEIESRYGKLTVSIDDLKAIHFKPTGAASRTVDVTPDHQPPGKWFDTRLDVEKKQMVRIEASGATQVNDWGVSSGPAGTTRYSGNTFGGFPMLSLVGKVGKNGKPFKVGGKYEARSRESGRLYLAIVPFQYNPGSVTGKYEAKIKLRAEQ